MRVSDELSRPSAPALGTAVRILQPVGARGGWLRPTQDPLDRASLPGVAAIGRTREGSTARLENPHPEGALARLSWIAARHGGWKLADHPPSLKIMARGRQCFAGVLSGAFHATFGSIPRSR